MKNTTAGIQILRYLSNQGVRIFSLDQAKEAASILNVRSGYVTEALHHLIKGNWIYRIKKGVFAFTAESGISDPPHEFEIAMALASSCAISHWTAMHFHHLTQQVPNTVFATAPFTVLIPRSIDNKRFHFVQVKPSYFFGHQLVWIENRQVKITDPERTLIDGLMCPQHCGDFQEVLHGFKMGRKKLDFDRAVQYALRLDQAVAKRLGWVLEQLNIESRIIRPLLEAPIKGYRKLNPQGSAKGKNNRKWMLLENLEK